ncbi:ArpU family phage packaging/lysis transcriptional regulator [Paenibacillus sp. YYML68]|uniref:ArpU family phage packaging/lysis transcriptional regulator n=1 Tax=Paenibacillus sp. YYML68 TaxID=2909250 RepID=UPI002490B82A|nr:ArpU family phage packaging/lysis transcriptional regulator [Paenibacillus sp. YYML68]
MGQLSFKLLEIDQDETRRRVEEALEAARTYKGIEKLEFKTKPVEAAVQRLGKLQREIIRKRYLEDEDVYDFNVYAELNISERTYYRVKSKAFYRLAFMLNLEVLIEPSESIAEG